MIDPVVEQKGDERRERRGVIIWWSGPPDIRKWYCYHIDIDIMLILILIPYWYWYHIEKISSSDNNDCWLLMQLVDVFPWFGPFPQSLRVLRVLASVTKESDSPVLSARHMTVSRVTAVTSLFVTQQNSSVGENFSPVLHLPLLCSWTVRREKCCSLFCGGLPLLMIVKI